MSIKDGVSLEAQPCVHRVGGRTRTFCSRRKDEKSVVGMLALTAMAAAMGSAFAQDADKAAPALTAAEEQASEDLFRALCPAATACCTKGRHRQNLSRTGRIRRQGRQRYRRRAHAQAGPESSGKIIGYGTDGGMVNFDDIPDQEEISLMSKCHPEQPRMCRRSSASRRWIPGRSSCQSGSSDQADES